ncbi:MAG TPA: biotin transporter BioY [Silvibacterium sp.]|nr:biotin transporter BioY [Silvibacterium sp.]
MNQAQIAVPASALRLKAVSPLLFQAMVAVAGSMLVAVCAHVSVPLLFTPVPLTLQTFAVLLLGLTLNPATAFAALTLYLAEGAAGLAVFSPHGPGGILQLMGPTGGYLLSYPLAAAMTGLIARRSRMSFGRCALSAAAGSLVILALGAGWFGVLAHQSLATILKLTVWPFLPGDALKVCAAAGIAAGLSWARNRFRGASRSSADVL